MGGNLRGVLLTAGGDITAGSLAVRTINAPGSLLTVDQGAINPILFSPGGASVQHSFTVDRISAAGGIDFSGDRFFGIDNNYTGGLLTINANTLTFDGMNGIAFANFNGADGFSTPTGAGGSGGTFIVNAAGALTVNAPITATTGINAANIIGGFGATILGGAGGTVRLHSATGTVAIGNTTIEVSSDDPNTSRRSASGGQIELTSSAASGSAINIGSTAQLLALLNNQAPGPGGSIVLRADGVASTIDVNNGDGQIVASRGLVDIRHLGDFGAINLTLPNMFADVLKVGALGANGTLTITGGTISADAILRLYAGGSNGSIIFAGNVTLSSQSTATVIAAHSVTILDGFTVFIAGPDPAMVFTDIANYALVSGGNGTTTGMFGGSGANTFPFADAPPFDGTGGATTVTYGGAPSGSWSNAAVWNPMIVPNNGNGGNIFDVVMGSGTVTQDIASGVTIEQLFMNGGTIVLTNPLSLNAGLQFTGGTLRDGTLNLAGGSQQSAPMTVSNTTINNAGDYELTLESGDVFSGANSLFNNFGNLIKSGTGGVNFNIGLSTTGTVSVQNGTLRLTAGGTLGGTLAAENGAVLELANNYTIADGSVFSGVGLLRLANTTTTTIGGTFTNSGTVALNSAGNFTDLTLSGDTTLTGGGTFLLSNAGRVRGSGILTLANQIVAGETSNSGSFGNNEIGIVNQSGSVIDANVNGLFLLVEPNSANGLVNFGTMQASSGGLLRLGGGAFDNSGGLIQALNGSEVQILGGRALTGGTLSTSGTGVIRTLGSSAIFGNLTNAGAFRISNGTDATFFGTINNTGSINVNGTGNFTDFIVSGNLTLQGGGVVTLMGAGQIRGGGTLFIGGANGETQTIQGETSISSASLGAGAIGIVNRSGGVIDANVAGLSLVVDPSASGGLMNLGLMRASNGGILRLTGRSGGGIFDNNGGTISALNGSQVQLSAGAVVNSGTLATSGSGTIRNLDTAVLSNTTVAGNFIGDNGSTTTISNAALTNSGTVTINSTGSFTDLVLNGSTTLTGGGLLNLSNAARVRGSGTFENVDNTIQGETNNTGSLGANEIGIVNQSAGLIDANINGLVLDVDPNASGVFNHGLIRASNGGILRLNGNGGGNGFFGDGTIAALDGSTVQLTNGALISSLTLSTSGTGVFRNLNTASLSSVLLAGNFIANNGSTTTIAGSILNTGSLTINSAGSFTDLLLNGDVLLSGSGLLNLSNAARVRGSGTLNNLDSTIQGETNNTGSLGANEIGIANGASGLIDANVASLVLDVDPDANGVFNQGVMRASGGGILRLNGNGGGGFSGGGTISALDGSTVQLTNGAFLTDLTLSTSGTGVFRNLNTATLTALTLAGNFIAENGTVTTIGSTIINQGSITINSSGNFTDLVLNQQTTLDGGGMLILFNAARVRGTDVLINANNTIQGETSNTGSLGANEIGILNQSGGVIDANVNGLVLDVDPSSTSGLENQGLMRASNGGILQLNGNGGGAFTNSGTISAITGGVLRFNGTVNSSGTVDVGANTLTATGNYTQSGGTFLLAGGSVQSNNPLSFQGGLLDARGTINAAIMNNAMLRPALGGSGLAVTGNVSLLSSSQLIFQLGGLAQGSQYRLHERQRHRHARRAVRALLREWLPEYRHRRRTPSRCCLRAPPSSARSPTLPPAIA